jgi:hypothetical protein
MVPTIAACLKALASDRFTSRHRLLVLPASGGVA